MTATLEHTTRTDAVPAGDLRAADQGRIVRMLGTLVVVAGLVLGLTGAGTWAMVQTSLAAENITVAEDADRFAGATVGRVVHTDRALSSCTPVNDRLVGEAVVFRTAASSRLAAATADAVVAFEVDEIDPISATGWTVLVTGAATGVRDVSTLVRLEQLGLVAWAGSDR